MDQKLIPITEGTTLTTSGTHTTISTVMQLQQKDTCGIVNGGVVGGPITISISPTIPLISGGNGCVVLNGTITTSTTTTAITPPAAIAATTIVNVGNKQSYTIPSDILDDLASRFIINSPVDERNNLIRLCFQIELAHWFYLDFFCEIEEKKLIPCGIKQFTINLFQHIPFFRKHLSGIDKILEDWKEYKLTVPTYGAILVSEDLTHVLLVQSYWAKSSWGFPKGKINENEDPVHCATREVYEETGYDITGLIVPKDYIEAVINYQYTRLYIIRNVPSETKFSPRTRKEIKCCEWFPLDSLPINKNDALCKQQLGINANSFFMIMPFMKRLKKWINDNRSGIEHKFSSSPITTFNNGENYNTNNNNNNNNNGSIINSGNKNSVKKLILDLQQHQQQFDNKNEIMNMCNTNNNNNNNSYALKTNNSNKINNNNNKRQRHKSMGDIDGIKLINMNNNITNNMAKSYYNNQNIINHNNNNSNNNNNNNNSIASTKLISNNNLNITTTPTIITSSTPKNNNNNECFFEDNNNNNNLSSNKKIQSSYSTSKIYQTSTNLSNSATPNSTTIIIPNSKRQLFNCISVDNSIITNNNNKHHRQSSSLINNNFLDAIIKKQNQNNNNSRNSIGDNLTKISRKDTTIKDKDTINCKNNNNNNNNKKSGNMRLRTKSLGQQQNQQINFANKNNVQRKNSTNSNENNNNNNNNNNSNGNGSNSMDGNNTTNLNNNNCLKKKLQPLSQQQQQLKQFDNNQQQQQKIHQLQQQQQNISEKFNPNFESWTNFSFTKNFITNVFC